MLVSFKIPFKGEGLWGLGKCGVLLIFPEYALQSWGASYIQAYMVLYTPFNKEWDNGKCTVLGILTHSNKTRESYE